MNRHSAFVIIVALMFIAFALLFITFPRPMFSELERRELAQFPEFSTEKLADGSFTSEVSSWFSDSQPYRDRFMMLSQTLKKYIGIDVPGDTAQVTFVAPDPEPEPEPEPDPMEIEKSNRDIADFDNNTNANGVAKIAHAGIVITGSEPNARALMAYGGAPEGGKAYADMVNRYKDKFGAGVNVYCMVVPTAIEFYCPDAVKKKAKSQSATIRNIYANLSDSVHAVDVYTTLGRHAAEPVFLRTDHHWSPLGAYYAAETFARVAGVPFRGMAEYIPKSIPGFVGTMYGYSKDIAIKNSPEEFVYYEPRDTAYTTTFITFSLDEEFKIIGESRPYKSEYFKHLKSRGMAYSTFMGGDAMIVKVQTGQPGGRRLAVIKDSFGNAVPGNLFGSFEEIHVLDFRYFPRNIVKYVRDNGITDFLFINNIFNAYSSGVANSYKKLLTN